MAKIDKYYNFMGLKNNYEYNYKDKDTNVFNSITYMINRSNIMFEWSNLPDTIPSEELEKMLQVNGFVVVGKIQDNLYALNASLGGEPDVYNRPTKALVNVPSLKYNAEWNIGSDCVVIKNDSNAIGLLPMYSKYCSLMNENEITMLLADVNKRIDLLLSAGDTNTIESAKQFIKDIFNGNLGVIAESKLLESLKVSKNVESHVSMIDLIEYEQYLKASLYNEIGLNANFNMKRERLTAGEVEMNSDNLYPLVDNMLACRRKALDSINDLFNTDIEVQLNSSWDYRVLNGYSIDNPEDEEPEIIEATEEIEDTEVAPEILDHEENEEKEVELDEAE